MTTQATADKPSKRYWDLDKAGLIDAAKAVGATGTVAIGLVEKIGKLLWG